MKIFYGVSFTHGFCILVVPIKKKKDNREKVDEKSEVLTHETLE